MIELFNNLPKAGGWLALGGIGAILATAWGQIKMLFSYISGFLILSCSVSDYDLAKIIRMKLQNDFYEVPKGQLIVQAFRRQMPKKSFQSVIPYIGISNFAIYIKGWRIIWMKCNATNYVELHTIRGMFNFKTFINTTLDDYESKKEKLASSKKDDRYRVVKIIGSEKTIGKPIGPRRRVDNDRRDEGNSGVSNSPQTTIESSPEEMKPFRFEGHDFSKDGEAENPLDGLYYEDFILKYIDQAKLWFSKSQWYLEHGIPWKRGWLLWGPPGTGKSSLAKVVGKTLGIPIYHFHLNTLSDQEFMRDWDEMVTPCIALLEDIDNVFNKRESLTEHKSLSFDCLLNTISGVSSTNGIFLIVTTNKLDHIDEALGVSVTEDGLSSRPGRIDRTIFIGNISKENKLKMATRILGAWPEEIEKIMIGAEDRSPIQFQEMCIQVAIEKLSKEEQ